MWCDVMWCVCVCFFFSQDGPSAEGLNYEFQDTVGKMMRSDETQLLLSNIELLLCGLQTNLTLLTSDLENNINYTDELTSRYDSYAHELERMTNTSSTMIIQMVFFLFDLFFS